MNRYPYLFGMLVFLLGAPGMAQEKQIINSLGMRMVPVPAGTFQMGSPENEKGREKQEARHEVVLTKGFYLGAHEVTVGQFREFVEAAKYKTEAEKDGKGGWGVNAAGSFEENGKFTWKSPGFEQGDDHPVVLVSWNDANAFCRWLSQKEKATYRLPSEAEWEYACRGGGDTAYHFGNDPRLLTQYGNLFHHAAGGSRDGYRFTAPVGRFKPNDHGLYDMRRSAARIGRDPSSYRGAYLGFRVVREK